MDTCTGQSKVHRDARIALLLVILPNLLLIFATGHFLPN
jgi:hypothetical protein